MDFINDIKNAMNIKNLVGDKTLNIFEKQIYGVLKDDQNFEEIFIICKSSETGKLLVGKSKIKKNNKQGFKKFYDFFQDLISGNFTI